MKNSENNNVGPNAGDGQPVGTLAAKAGADAKRSNYQPSRYYTIDGVADLFDVSPRTVRRWIDDGELVAHKINNVVRISDRDLSEFSARHRGN